jgi:hypothetical protein
MFNSTLADNTSTTYLYPVCVYYNTSSNAWSRDGVYNISYDYTTGLLNCSTSHLSEFSMDYISLNKVSINVDPTSNTTNGTTSYFFD